MKNFKPRSLFFAPMEGVTDAYYRETVAGLYPEWDFYSTDFLRIPSTGLYRPVHFLKHVGEEVYKSPIMNKTIFQILVSDNSLLDEHLPILNELNFNWVDINLGCPSKTVCKNKGGSYLLSDLKALERIISKIRTAHRHTFTAKIRVGYEDDRQFPNIIRLLDHCGVDAITIHGRTRTELYRGVANWDYIKTAVKLTSLPIIGNGDIWNPDDIKKYYDYTGAHSIMLGRSALKTPWLAKLVKEDLEDSLELRKAYAQNYFNSLYEKLMTTGVEESTAVKRLKGLARYIFDPFPDFEVKKRSFLLAKNFHTMQEALEKL